MPLLVRRRDLWPSRGHQTGPTCHSWAV
jgi:hypothetical protein